MINEKAIDLARRSTELIRKGKSFVFIWDTVLKRHPLVEGIPHEKFDHQRMPNCPLLIAAAPIVRFADGEWSNGIQSCDHSIGS